MKKTNYKNASKTERVLLSTVGIMLLALVLGASLPKITSTHIYAEEGEGSSEQSTEQSSNDQESTPSENEESTPSTPSTDEVSTEEVSTPSTDEMSTPSTPSTDEMSTEEISTPSTDETSTPSTPSTDEPSTISTPEESVASGIDIDNFVDGEVIRIGDTQAYVFEDERLLFLIPVKVEKRLTLDENGVVVDMQQSFLSRLIDLLSF